MYRKLKPRSIIALLTVGTLGGRVIGTDTLRILLVLQVSSDGQKREQGRKDNPNIKAHQSTLPPHSCEWLGNPDNRGAASQPTYGRA
jgi:hypothetical protein